MSAAFLPPPLNPSKTQIPHWIPPEPTKMDIEWAQLRTIELSHLDSPDPEVVAELVEATKQAIKQDGFLYLTDYGVSLEQVSAPGCSSPEAFFVIRNP
jgi:hypothetical protein